jgi:hypothetical protein
MKPTMAYREQRRLSRRLEARPGSLQLWLQPALHVPDAGYEIGFLLKKRLIM